MGTTVLLRWSCLALGCAVLVSSSEQNILQASQPHKIVKTVKRCRDNCNDHGSCNQNDGTCVCHNGWTGPTCKDSECLMGCVHGICHAGTCLCEPGYSGVDCTAQGCDPACKNGGVCVDKKCECDVYYTGPSCESLRCPLDCSGHGECYEGVCDCKYGWFGPGCDTYSDGPRYNCDPICRNNGTCDVETRLCICPIGWSGRGCEVQEVCPQNCSFHGNCIDEECACDFGYSGRACETRRLGPPHHGVITNGSIECDPGWGAPMCTTQSCPDDCSNHGNCLKGKCSCDDGWAGLTCVEQIIPHGRIIRGVAHCAPGWMSRVPNKDCDVRGCEAGCVHGSCVDSICRCLPGWEGVSCENLGCPDSCSGHGSCEEGLCACYDGWMGVSCGHVACPQDCNDRGYCLNGRCQCLFGWSGLACTERHCLNDCSGHGQCENETDCLCDSGWSGPDCSIPDGFKHGDCFNGSCQCHDNWFGSNCDSRCHFACNDRGHCAGTSPSDYVCLCYEGYIGDVCEMVDVCPNRCHGNGHCKNGVCHCYGAWETSSCSTRLLPNRHGQLVARPDPGTNMSGVGADGPTFHCVVHCFDGWMGFNGELVDCGLMDSTLDNFCDIADCSPRGGFHSDSVDWVQNKGVHDSTSIPEGCPRGDNSSCPNDCMDHGHCRFDGRCVCDTGYYEEDCSIYYLPKGGHGKIVYSWVVDPEKPEETLLNFTVVCDGRYSPPYCVEAPPCPKNCSYPNGECVAGICHCKPEYTGEDCTAIAPVPRGMEEQRGCYCLPILVDPKDGHYIARGMALPTSYPQCVDATEVHPVRCCADSDRGAGWQQNSNCSVWASSTIEDSDCNVGSTFEEATSLCAKLGARLCTKDEVAKDCTAGTGCQHDENMIWTSTVCGQLDSDIAWFDPDNTSNTGPQKACKWICPPPPFKYGAGPSSYGTGSEGFGEVSEGGGGGDDGFKALTDVALGFPLSASPSPSPPGCPNDCNGHGMCEDHICTCYKGWFGKDCYYDRNRTIYTCPPPCKVEPQDCWDYGSCEYDPNVRKYLTKEQDYDDVTINGICKCVPGFNTSTMCRFSSCPYCNEHGYCVQSGVSGCMCEKYWHGIYCELVVPTKNIWYRMKHSAQIDPMYAHTTTTGKTKDLPKTAMYMVSGAGAHGLMVDMYKFTLSEGFKIMGPMSEKQVVPMSANEALMQEMLREQTPAARAGSATTFVNTNEDRNGFVYLFGGAGWRNVNNPVPGDITKDKSYQPIIQQAHYFNDLWKFDVRAEHWLKEDAASSPPTGRWRHTITSMHNTNLLLFGGVYFRLQYGQTSRYLKHTGEAGFATPGWQFLDDMWTYNLFNKKWMMTKVLSRARPGKRAGHSMTQVPNTMASILFGGFNGVEHLNDVWWIELNADLTIHCVQLRSCQSAGWKPTLLRVTGDPDSVEYKKILGLPDRGWLKKPEKPDLQTDAENAADQTEEQNPNDEGLDEDDAEKAGAYAVGAEDEQNPSNSDDLQSGAEDENDSTDSAPIEPGMATLLQLEAELSRVDYPGTVGKGDVLWGTSQPPYENMTFVDPLGIHHENKVSKHSKAIGDIPPKLLDDYGDFGDQCPPHFVPSWNDEVPEGRAHHVGILTGGQELLIGMGEGSGTRMVDTFWTFSFVSQNWTQVEFDLEESHHGVPTMRTLTSGVFMHDKLIMFGGQDQDTKALDDVWALDLHPKDGFDALTLPENENDILASAAVHPWALADEEYNKLKIAGETKNREAPLQPSPSPFVEGADDDSGGPSSVADLAPDLEFGVGLDEGNPARSCTDIYASARAAGKESELVDGLYWIKHENSPGGKKEQIECVYSVAGGGWTAVYDDSKQEQVKQEISSDLESMVVGQALIYNALDPPEYRVVDLAVRPYLTTIGTLKKKKWIGVKNKYKRCGPSGPNNTASFFLTDAATMTGSANVPGGVKCSDGTGKTDIRQTEYSTTPNGLLTFGVTNDQYFAAGGTCSYTAVPSNQKHLARKLLVRTGNPKEEKDNYLRGLAEVGVGPTAENPASSCSAIEETLYNLGTATPADGTYWIKPEGQEKARFTKCLFGSQEHTKKYGSGWTMAFDDSDSNQVFQDMSFVKDMKFNEVLVFTTDSLKSNEGKIHELYNMPDKTDDFMETESMLTPRSMSEVYARNWYGQDGYDKRYGGITAEGKTLGTSLSNDEQPHYRYKYVSSPQNDMSQELPKTEVLMLHDTLDAKGGSNAAQDGIIGGETCHDELTLSFDCLKTETPHPKLPQVCYPLTPHGLLAYGTEGDNFVIGGCSYNTNTEAKKKFVVQMWIRMALKKSEDEGPEAPGL